MTHPTDALRLVPRRAVYDWLRDDVPLNVATTIMPHHIDALMDRLSEAAPASPLPGSGWQDISTAPKDEGVKVMAFDGTKVGEAVLYGEWEESNDFEDAVLRWRWANDSCSCCWGKAEPQPTHWMPLPAAPTGDAG